MLAVRSRATDGRGTYTLPDSQPCRLLPAHTHNSPFSELRFRFRASTLHLVILAYLPLQLAPSGHYTSERLTTPYSGKLLRFHGSFTVGNIARFPLSRKETPLGLGSGLFSPLSAWFPVGATILLPYRESRSNPSQNRTSSFPTSGSSFCHSVSLRPPTGVQVDVNTRLGPTDRL